MIYGRHIVGPFPDNEQNKDDLKAGDDTKVIAEVKSPVGIPGSNSLNNGCTNGERPYFREYGMSGNFPPELNKTEQISKTFQCKHNGKLRGMVLIKCRGYDAGSDEYHYPEYLINTGIQPSEFFSRYSHPAGNNSIENISKQPYSYQENNNSPAVDRP